MVQAPAGEDWAASSYWHSAQEGRRLAHAHGNSGDNLRTLMSLPLELEQVPESRSQQPPTMVPKPDRSEPAAAAGSSLPGSSLTGSPSGSASLDQFAPMLPGDPVQQLPLLPTSTVTSTTCRVAAWLLNHADADAAAAAANDACGCAEGAADDSGDDCADLALLELADSLDEALPPPPLPAVTAPTAAAAVSSPAAPGAGGRAASEGAAREEDCEGYRPTAYYADTGRRSLDAFMSKPVQHGDALNNWVAALY